MKIDPRFLFVLASLAFVASCADPGAYSGSEESLAPVSVPTRRLVVDGSRLRDVHGREVILRGFNAGGRAKMPPFLPFDLAPGETLEDAADAYFARVEALGANVVRLTFSWEAFESVRGTYDMAYLARYETLLDAAGAHGLTVIVDFHQDVFASPFCGDGFPLWAIGNVPHGEPHYDCSFPWWSLPAFNPISGVSLAFDRLWNNRDGLQDAMEAMWRTVARELRDHPAVGAFEVMNEPGAGIYATENFDANVLPPFYERMGRAIRAEAGDVAIFWDGRIGSTGVPPTLRPPSLPGAVYAPHYYEEFIAMGFPFVLKDTIREDLRASFSPTTRWNMPVFLGEFGVPNANRAKGAYLDFALDVVDELRGHATMWEASSSATLWNGEDFSVLDPSGAERSWAGTVVRAYPRAIAGRIDRFLWDADARRFELDVSQARAGVSEVYVPARHLGAAPRIEVTGARFTHLPDRELLLLEADPGRSYRVVVRR
jgi:endoglycosylceramidase